MGLEEKVRRSKLITRIERLLDEHSKTYEIVDEVPGEITIRYPVVAVEEPEADPMAEAIAASAAEQAAADRTDTTASSTPPTPEPEPEPEPEPTPPPEPEPEPVVPLAELRRRAGELEIPGRSKLKRDALVAAIEAAEAE